MQIFPLAEGVFTVDRTKVFMPFILGKDQLQERPVGSLLVEVQPFLVQTSRDLILLDTGLGFRENSQLQICANIENAGFLATDVTKVLLSHLHKDHAGGICFINEFGEIKPVFPNATYYVNEKELSFSLEKPSSSYVATSGIFLGSYENVQLLNGDGFIDGYIEYRLSGGHAPFHQVFWIRENGAIIFYGGDEAPQLQQMKNKIIAKYDFNGRLSMQMRQAWWEQGNSENWTFLFYHDVKTPLYQKGS